MLPSNTLKLPRLNLHGRQLFDLEMLLHGGFAPLGAFMNAADYNSVCETMRLGDGVLFPIPIVLDVPRESPHQAGDSVVLCDEYGNPLAIMRIESRYTPDKKREALLVYGTEDETHPGVAYLMHHMQDTYLGGTIESIQHPVRHDFNEFRHTPETLKMLFKERGWERVIGFQTRNPMHRVHFELVKRAHEKVGAPVLIHPVVGMTREGDVDYITRVRTYKTVREKYAKDFSELSLLPLSMRMAGPREALWHALVRKNYGCTHFIVGRDHAGPGTNKDGAPFYDSNAARMLAEEYGPEIGIEILPSEELVYSASRKAYVSNGELEANERTENISGTEFRRRLREGEEIPDWFSFPECIDELRRGVERQSRVGVTIFFTGLSGAGKSTIAAMLASKLRELQDREVTLLDGDIIREHLTKGLGFSKEDRDTNVKRVGYVASEITKHGGIAITSLIAPYKEAREAVRELVERSGVFVEVYVATSLAVCEARDTKGLYEKARKGLLKDFTGVDDPYEIPEDTEVTLDTEHQSAEESVETIVACLRARSLLK